MIWKTTFNHLPQDVILERRIELFEQRSIVYGRYWLLEHFLLKCLQRP